MNATKSVLRFGIERTAATAPMKKANSDDFSKRSCVLSAGTLSVLLALAGCGGGGGGTGGAPSGAAFVYPSSLAAATPTDTVNGFVSPYALDTATPELVSVPQMVLSAVPHAGQLDISVSDIELPSGADTEPAFFVTFDPASSGLPLDNNPLESLCPGCPSLVTATATSFVGGAPAGLVTFTYLDPASSPLNYSTLGMLTKPSAVSTIWSEVGGPFSAGVLTRGMDFPTISTASYDGFFIGRYATSDTTDPSLPPPGTYIVGANAHVVVVNGAITSFSTSNTHISREMGGGILETPIPEQRLDLSTTTAMAITQPPTSNAFEGEGGTLTNGFEMGANGQIGGAFYGPPAATTPFAPPELGGSLAVGTVNQKMRIVGSFGLKKAP